MRHAPFRPDKLPRSMMVLSILCVILTGFCMVLITHYKALLRIVAEKEEALQRYERIIYNGEDEQ